MVTPPAPWTSHKEGGYLSLSSSIMRTHGCKVQAQCLANSASSLTKVSLTQSSLALMEDENTSHY